MMRQTPTSWWNRPDRYHCSCSRPEARLTRTRPRPQPLCNPTILLADTRRRPSPLLAGPNGVPIVRFAKGTQGGGPGPDPRDTAIHRRMLAETWIEATAARDGLAGRSSSIGTATQAADGATQSSRRPG